VELRRRNDEKMEGDMERKVVENRGDYDDVCDVCRGPGRYDKLE